MNKRTKEYRRYAEQRRIERLTETGEGVRIYRPGVGDVTQQVNEAAFASRVAALAPLPADHNPNTAH